MTEHRSKRAAEPTGNTASPAGIDAIDVIDACAGLVGGDALHSARRFRAKVVEASQASHDALLLQPLPGLSRADRLHVAEHVAQAALAPALAAHYQALLQTAAGVQERASPALPAMLQFAGQMTTHPRRAERADILALQQAGLDDASIVALAQLVAFLAYQTRVVAGLQALQMDLQQRLGSGLAPASTGDDAAAAKPPLPTLPGTVAVPPVPEGGLPIIHHKGFTNETLLWHSWLQPLNLAQATPLQLAVLDEAHAQARSSAYYLTLAHQPWLLRYRSAAYNSIMYAPGGLPRAERELGAMMVSVTNGCVYCTSVHAQRFAQLAKRQDSVAQVFDDPATAGTNPRERAIAGFAQAVTLRPHTLGGQDMQALRVVGMNETQIIDLLHALAIFGWANRLMHKLGEPVATSAAKN